MGTIGSPYFWGQDSLPESDVNAVYENTYKKSTKIGVKKHLTSEAEFCIFNYSNI
jgi:hypothetical protein